MITSIKEKNKAKRTDFRLIAIDQTKYWRDELQAACGKIFTVYFYNKNEHTYCCELMPSYYLIPLYSYSENEVSEDILDDLEEGDRENQGEGSYFHVSNIDKCKTVKAPKGLDGVYYANDGRKYRELYDEAEEYLNGNHQI